MAGRTKIRLNLYILTFIAYWYAPVVYGLYLWRNLKMGAFAVDNDSIAIPLIGFVFLWFVGFPFLVLSTLAIEMLLRKYDRRRRARMTL